MKRVRSFVVATVCVLAVGGGTAAGCSSNGSGLPTSCKDPINGTGVCVEALSEAPPAGVPDSCTGSTYFFVAGNPEGLDSCDDGYYLLCEDGVFQQFTCDNPGSGWTSAGSIDGGSGSGDSGAETSTGPDASGGDTSVHEASGPCNTIVPAGQSVSVSEVQMTPPAPAAGTVADGTYQLTAETLYADNGLLPELDGGIAGTAQPTTIVVSGTTWQWAGGDESTGVPTTYSASTSGTTLTLTIACPPNTDSALIVLYTTTQNQILLYEAVMGGDVSLSQPLTVSTYTLQ